MNIENVPTSEAAIYPPRHKNNGERDRGSQIHRRREQTAKTRGADGFRAHTLRVLDEFFAHIVFDDKRFYRLCARYALVEIARYLRVYLADFTVDAYKQILEYREKNGDQRNDRDDERREFGVDREHDDYRADKIRSVPHAVDHRPRNERAYTRGVAHNAGVDIADAVLIEI